MEYKASCVKILKGIQAGIQEGLTPTFPLEISKQKNPSSFPRIFVETGLLFCRFSKQIPRNPLHSFLAKDYPQGTVKDQGAEPRIEPDQPIRHRYIRSGRVWFGDGDMSSHFDPFHPEPWLSLRGTWTL